MDKQKRHTKSNEQDFLRSIFWPEGKKYKISLIDDYRYAIDQAFKDMNVRTLIVVDKNQTGEDRKNCFYKDSEIEIRLHNYIHNGIGAPFKSFDEWHKDTCIRIQKALSSHYKGVKYGKAQKLLNMSFKYLYCFDGIDDEIKNKFGPCHMALDSYILNWVKSDVLPWYNNKLKDEGKTKIQIGLINDKYTWSNLKSSDNEQEYSYQWFKKIIGDYLEENYLAHSYKTEDNKPLTPFEAEFYIWPEQQWKEASKKLLGLKESMIALASQSKPENFDEISKLIKEINSKLNL